MESLTIKLPAELRARVEEQARLSGRSVSAVVREALARTTRRAGSSRKPSLLDLAGDLRGCFDSGVRDLGSNRAHMEGFGAWRR